jgi:hypothetical protein
MTERTLFIHAGGSKTGSSAIQDFLGMNKPKLARSGIAFENWETHEYQTNNGILLYNALLSPCMTKNEIDGLVLSYFGKCNNAICSSEYFQLLQAQNWKKLLESLFRLGVTLKVIMYVRNVIPFLLSSYDQAIKHHGENREFDQWVDECDYGHASALRIIVDLIPRSNIQVLHFESEKANLIRCFLDSLGIDSTFKIKHESSKRKVNRSLTNEERELFIFLNKTNRKAYIQELFDLFVYVKPNALGEPATYHKTMEEVLVLRFSNEVDWINNTFFEGKPVVSVLPMKSVKNQIIKPIHVCSADMQILGWALEKLKTIQNETECRILDSLNNAVSQNASKNYPPEIPAHFDALAYLLLNRDVLHSGMDPIQHYINHGKTEGRRYSF